MQSEREPAPGWLFWDLLRLWAWQCVLSLACVSTGLRTLSWFDTPQRTPLQTVALAFPIGFLVFALGFYGLGHLGLFRWYTAAAWPVVLTAAGAPLLWRHWRTSISTTAVLRASSSLRSAWMMLGGAALGWVYLGILSPDAVNYDAAWMHLAISQSYAHFGKVVPFNGDWVKGVPHLASVVHTWDFLVPGIGNVQPLRWMMALHTEFSCFVWTLVGIAAATQWVLRRSVPASWLIMFLFPAILAYDSNMGGAADHVLALFAVPLVVLAYSVWREFNWRACVLFAFVSGGAMLVKLQAIYIVTPLAAISLVAFFVHAWRIRRRISASRHFVNLSLSAALIPTVAAFVFAFHAATNWRFHGNPLYPLMQNVFPRSHPHLADAATQINYLFSDWRWLPPVPLGERLWDAIKLLWSFSFVPHYSFQKDAPITGSLFTLTIPFLLFVKPNRRTFLFALCALGAVFCWAMTYRVDRNLQVFMPLLVVSTASLLIAGWQEGWASKVGVVLLVGMQLICSGDVWFSGTDRVVSALSLIRSSADGRADRRYAEYRKPYIEVNNALPANAVVLMHGQHGSLGIERTVLLDGAGFQGQIDYRRMGSARDVWTRLKELGVTHIVTMPSMSSAATKQEEILFAVFAKNYEKDVKSFGYLQMFALPTEPPAVSQPYSVGVIGIEGMQDGLYEIHDLGQIETYPPHMHSTPRAREATNEVKVLSAKAQAFLLGNNVSADINLQVGAEFQTVVYKPGFRVLWRMPPDASR